MALWKAVADRHDLLVATWDSGRVGPTELARLSTLVWGRLDALPRPPIILCSDTPPVPAGALAVSLPEACRLSDALAASLRARLGSTRPRPTSRRGFARCAPRSNGCVTSSTASRRSTTPPPHRCSTGSTAASPTCSPG